MDELKIWDIFVGKCVTMTFFFFNGKLTKFNSDCSEEGRTFSISIMNGTDVTSRGIN